jgi:hypothetical protein
VCAAVLESPAGSTSGLGVIRGWKCEKVGTLTFIIDDFPPGPLSYGVERGDTEGNCGDKNNGFVTLFNWNDVGPGEHTIRVFDNGVEFARSTFTVTTLGTAYLTGAVSSCVARIAGQDVTVSWQEDLQNFVITATTGDDAPPPDDPPPAYPNVKGVWDVSLNYIGDNCNFIEVPPDLPTSINGTANVAQDGGNLSVVAQGILEEEVLLTGQLKTNGDFAVSSPPSSDTTASCTYNLVASFDGNFQTGEGGLEVTVTYKSGNCEGFSLPCSVLYDGTFTKQ